MKTKEFVVGFIADNFTEKICYHNIDHTLEVVEAAELIAVHCGVTNADLEIVLVAAWFHDTGYYLGCENHEEASANIAKTFLEKENLGSGFIKKVINCIRSTKIPQSPNSLLDRIICDADLYHLATEHYFDKSELLWLELKLNNQQITPEFWLNESKKFFENHEFHTTFGKENLTPLRQKNLDLIKTKIKEIQY